jgi:hypothetical protein
MNVGSLRQQATRALGALCIAWAGVFGLAGCGGGGGGGDTGGPVTPPAPTALTITAQSPAASATGVAVGSTISVSYSDTLATNPAFSVTVSGSAVAGTVSRSGATATFTPSAALPAGATVSVTVSGATGSAGGSQATSVTFSFGTQAATTTVTLQGKAEYESVPNDPSTGGLNYTGATFKPIRFATVQVIAAGSGSTLATGSTNEQGDYSLQVTAGQAVFVRVRAESVRSAGAGSWDYSVRDNTSGDAIYALDGSSVTPAGNTTINLRAGSGWSGSSYTQPRSAAPFAILDVTYDATQKVLSVSPGLSFPALRLMWSSNNRPVDGNLASGDIGTSFYRLNGNQHQIYILGAANTDTDEYDRMVVAHEFGHYLQSAFSRNDSIGGPHTGEEKLDMRVAFGEGFGNAWSGMVYNNPIYTDSLGAGQRLGGINDLSTLPTNRGWYSEDSVQYLLYRWHGETAIGFAPLWQVLREYNTTLSQQGALTSLHSFAHQLKLLRQAQASAIDTALNIQQVTVADALGSTESNNGGITQALPLYRTLTLGAAQNVCVTDAAGTAGNESNKLGSYVFLRFNLGSAGTRSITVVGSTATSDPDFTLTRADGSETTHDDESTANEAETLSLSAGWYVIALYDYNLIRGAQGSSQSGVRCFNVTVQ